MSIVQAEIAGSWMDSGLENGGDFTKPNAPLLKAKRKSKKP